MKVNPERRVFGGPVDGSDLPPPTYVYRQGHAYMLMTEVGAMIERFARLPAAPVRQYRGLNEIFGIADPDLS